MQLFEATALSDGAFEQILSFLRAGGVIGFPTDTAYGLAADPFNESAIRRIFEIKGRPETKPILLLVDSLSMLQGLAEVSEVALTLPKHFWPAPLTMILPALGNVPRLLTAGTSGIGVRWPAAVFAISLIQLYGKPITATSANRTGMPAAVTAEEVSAQLKGDLEMLVDGRRLPARGGSTVLDLTHASPLLLRDGPISFETLNEVLQGSLRRP